MKLAREKEAHMSLTVAILMLVGMWLSVAAAMLWGVLRIVRRRYPHHHRPLKALPAASVRPAAAGQCALSETCSGSTQGASAIR